MLALNNIEVVYDGVILVLKGVSLNAEEGHITTLLGANGAGKTTTLKAISGLLKTEDGEVTRGEILFEGERINGIDPDKIVRRGILQVQEGRGILTRMTVQENLEMGAYGRSDKAGIRNDMEMVFGKFPVLRERRKQFGATLSGQLVPQHAVGSRRRLFDADRACGGPPRCAPGSRPNAPRNSGRRPDPSWDLRPLWADPLR